MRFDAARKRPVAASVEAMARPGEKRPIQK